MSIMKPRWRLEMGEIRGSDGVKIFLIFRTHQVLVSDDDNDVYTMIYDLFFLGWSIGRVGGAK